MFRRTQHHITAEVYSSDSVDPVLSCSTKEWALKRELGTTRSVTACRAVGEVLAQRCLEAGITRMVYREVPWKFRSESVSVYFFPFNSIFEVLYINGGNAQTNSCHFFPLQNQTFWTAMKEGGVILGEPRRKFI